MSSDGNVCASISHDEYVKFWSIENIKTIKIDAQSKSKNKTLKNKKISVSGKSENFFADLDDKADENDDSDEEDDDDDDGSDEEGKNSNKSDDEDSSDSD